MAQHLVVVGEGSVTSKVSAAGGDLCHKFFRIRADLRGVGRAATWFEAGKKK